MTVCKAAEAACPCCGQAIEGRLPVEMVAGYARLSGSQLVIFNRLARQFGCRVSTEVLADNLYSHRSDGGPDYADKIVRQFAYYLRKRIKPFGFTVVGYPGKGNSGFKLTWDART